MSEKIWLRCNEVAPEYCCGSCHEEIEQGYSEFFEHETNTAKLFTCCSWLEDVMKAGKDPGVLIDQYLKAHTIELKPSDVLDDCEYLQKVGNHNG